MSENRSKWALLVVLAVFVGACLALMNNGGNQAPVNEREPLPGQAKRDPSGSPVRPRRFEIPKPEPGSIEEMVGITQPVSLDSNPMTASLKEKGHPERRSTMMMPPAFDAKAYAANPEKYLNTVEPGRIWQSAQPGPGVPRASAASFQIVETLQGEPVPLKVKAAPGAPVTFTSVDLGAFSNKLTTITVAADSEGIATAMFTGTPGTYDDVHIIAASPVTSGQVRFVVTVVVPKLKELRQRERDASVTSNR